jgi:hypothetical protein
VRTRDRLNFGFFGGSIAGAALLGVLCQSEAVFWLAAIGLLTVNIWRDEIRWR